MSHILFCFPFAGGNADFYNDIEKYISNDIEVVKMEYPGHGMRHRESLCYDFHELTDDLIPSIKDKLQKSGSPGYSLFGYSMGSIVVSVIIDRIVRESVLPLPKHIFLAAHEPMSRSELVGFSEDELDEYVKSRTLLFGDVPEKLINNTVFWKVYLPVYRADFGMIGRFNFDSLPRDLGLPTTVFYSETDTPCEKISGWNHYFRDCQYVCYEGDHFFAKSHYEEMADEINERLIKQCHSEQANNHE